MILNKLEHQRIKDCGMKSYTCVKYPLMLQLIQNHTELPVLVCWTSLHTLKGARERKMSIINRLSTVKLNVSWLVIYRWLPKFIGTHPSRCRKSNSKWGVIIIGIQVWKIFGLNDDNEKWVLRMSLDLKNAMCFQTCKGPRRSLNPMIGYMFLRTLMNSSVGTVSMSHIMWRLQLVLNSICLVQLWKGCTVFQ